MEDTTEENLTIAEWALKSNNPVAMQCAFELYKTNCMLKDIPLRTESTIQLHVNDQIEQLYLIRNMFRIDTLLKEQIRKDVDLLQVLYRAWVQCFSGTVNHMLLFNEHATGNPNAPVGILPRISGREDPSQLTINCSGKTAWQLLDTFRNSFKLLGTESGEGCVIYCGKSLYKDLREAPEHKYKGFAIARDIFDNEILTLGNAKVRYAGTVATGDPSTSFVPLNREPVIFYDASQETREVIPSVDGKSSAFVVRYGKDHLRGWQPNLLKLLNLGLDPQTAANYNFVINWGVGIIDPETPCYVQLTDIQI